MFHVMYKRGEYWVATSDAKRDEDVQRGAKAHGEPQYSLEDAQRALSKRLLAGRGRPRKRG